MAQAAVDKKSRTKSPAKPATEYQRMRKGLLDAVKHQRVRTPVLCGFTGMGLEKGAIFHIPLKKTCNIETVLSHAEYREKRVRVSEAGFFSPLAALLYILTNNWYDKDGNLSEEVRDKVFGWTKAYYDVRDADIELAKAYVEGGAWATASRAERVMRFAPTEADLSVVNGIVTFKEKKKRAHPASADPQLAGAPAAKKRKVAAQSSAAVATSETLAEAILGSM